MKAALLPDRGVIKVIGDDARKFLHGLVTADVLEVAPGTARFCALLTPQRSNGFRSMVERIRSDARAAFAAAA